MIAARLGQLDHPHRRRRATLSTRSALQRGFQLPASRWGRVPRPADGIKREARPCLAAIAFHLEPAQAAVEALADCG